MYRAFLPSVFHNTILIFFSWFRYCSDFRWLFSAISEWWSTQECGNFANNSYIFFIQLISQDHEMHKFSEWLKQWVWSARGYPFCMSACKPTIWRNKVLYQITNISTDYHYLCLPYLNPRRNLGLCSYKDPNSSSLTHCFFYGNGFNLWKTHEVFSDQKIIFSAADIYITNTYCHLFLPRRVVSSTNMPLS